MSLVSLALNELGVSNSGPLARLLRLIGVPVPSPPTGTAGGDLGGFYPSPTVVGINGATAPATPVLADVGKFIVVAAPAVYGLASIPTPGVSTPYACPAGVAVGNAVYMTGSDAVDQALASSIATMPAIGVVAAKPTAVTCTIQYYDEAPGFVGLTPTDTYYVDDVTPGAMTTVAPAGTGKVLQRMGFARNATTLVVQVDRDFDVLE